MRSRRADLLRAAVLVACVGGARAEGLHVSVAASAPADAASAAAPADPRAARVEAAVERLRVDPLLSGKHRAHRLRWKSGEPDPDDRKTAEPDPSWFAWFASLVRFINDTSRFLMWGLIAAIVAALLVSARHFVQLRSFRRRASTRSAVSHVRDLDVRPESLPDDVGAAAWALWQSGRVPAALSLLYRGALSRLIHRFEVPITASATEGECLDLARARLEPTALRYITQVVRAWQASIYGGRALSLAMGEALCTGFAERLDGRARATKDAS